LTNVEKHRIVNSTHEQIRNVFSVRITCQFAFFSFSFSPCNCQYMTIFIHILAIAHKVSLVDNQPLSIPLNVLHGLIGVHHILY